jgi:hypothetical protein
MYGIDIGKWYNINVFVKPFGVICIAVKMEIMFRVSMPTSHILKTIDKVWTISISPFTTDYINSHNGLLAITYFSPYTNPSDAKLETISKHFVSYSLPTGD